MMIIFDMDGTIWDVCELTYKRVNEILKEKNIDYIISFDKIKGAMGLTAKEVAKKYMPNFDERLREQIVFELTKSTAEIIGKKGGNLYPYLEETLKGLSNKYDLGIVSNAKDNYVESLFKTTDFKKYFKDYIGASTYSISKVDAINEIIKRNNVKDAIYVGDTIRDQESAKEAGIPFIWASYGFGENIDSKYKINNLKELEEVIEQIKKDI